MPENAAGYFESAPFERTGFPADALRQLDPAPRLPMREQHWRAGQVIGALQRTGMQLQHFDEYPDAFWPQFPRWTKEVSGKLPMSYAILARKGR